MEKVVRAKPLFHLSTFVMDKSEDEERTEKFEDDFDQGIRKYSEQISRSANRYQAVQLRTNALKFIDQWRLEHLQRLDQCVRTAGNSVLNAFDEYQSRSIRRLVSGEWNRFF